MRHSRNLLAGAAVGAVLAAGGGGWLAAGELARLGAEALVAALEAQLPPGSDVAYEALDADPLGGAATLRGVSVRVGPDGTPGRRVTAAEVEFAGDAASWLAGQIGTLRARDLAADGPGGGRLGVAALELRDLAVTAVSALAEGRLPEAGGLGGAVADRLEFAQGDERATLARLALDGVDRAGLRGLAADDLRVATPGNGGGSLGGMRLASLDWSRVDLPAVRAAVARADAARAEAARRRPAAPAGQGGQAPAPRLRDDPGVFFAGLDLVLAVAEARASGLEFSGLDLGPAGPEPFAMRLGRLAVGELSTARLGPFELSGLDAGDAELKVAAQGARYDVLIDSFPLARLREAARTAPRTEAGAARVREILAAAAGRYEAGVDGLVVDDLDDGVRGGFARLTASGGTGAEREENRLAVEVLALDFGAAAARSGPDSAAARAARHIGNVTGGLVAAWSSDAAARTVSLDQLGLDLDNLGALDASLAGQAAEGAAAAPLTPDFNPLATNLARARVVYTDRSLVGRLLAAWGEPGGLPPDMVADAIAGSLADPRATPWLDAASREAISSFIRRPGRLEIDISPQGPLPAAAILSLATQSPATLPSVLGLRITATPP